MLLTGQTDLKLIENIKAYSRARADDSSVVLLRYPINPKSHFSALELRHSVLSYPMKSCGAHRCTVPCHTRCWQPAAFTRQSGGSERALLRIPPHPQGTALGCSRHCGHLRRSTLSNPVWLPHMAQDARNSIRKHILRAAGSDPTCGAPMRRLPRHKPTDNV